MRAAERAHLTETAVVDQHDQDVRRVLKAESRRDLELRFDRFGVLVSQANLARKRLFGPRQYLVGLRSMERMKSSDQRVIRMRLV